jgi:hypothetical protein
VAGIELGGSEVAARERDAQTHQGQLSLYVESWSLMICSLTPVRM